MVEYLVLVLQCGLCDGFGISAVLLTLLLFDNLKSSPWFWMIITKVFCSAGICCKRGSCSRMMDKLCQPALWYSCCEYIYTVHSHPSYCLTIQYRPLWFWVIDALCQPAVWCVVNESTQYTALCTTCTILDLCSWSVSNGWATLENVSKSRRVKKCLLSHIGKYNYFTLFH